MDTKLAASLRKLYSTCFSDSEAYVDDFFLALNERDVVALVCKGEAEAALYLSDRTLHFSGADFLSPFIVGAATQPHLRRQGKMETVISEALQRLKETGACFTALYPDIKGFYEKFGFVNFTHTGKRVIAPISENAKAVAAAPELLLSLYNKFCIQKNAYAVRNLKSFESMAKKLEIDGGAFKAYEHGGKMCYAALDDGNIVEACGEYQVLCHVKELHGKTMDIFCGKTPHGMLRLVNPFKVLKNFHYDFDGMLKFYLTDKFFPQNSGCYAIEVKNGKAEADFDKDGKSDMVMTVEELTESLSGTNVAGPLKKLIRKKQNICFDKY